MGKNGPLFTLSSAENGVVFLANESRSIINDDEEVVTEFLGSVGRWKRRGLSISLHAFVDCQMTPLGHRQGQ